MLQKSLPSLLTRDAMLAQYTLYTMILCLCPSVWPSVHRNQCSIKTAKVVITQNNNHDSTGALVFLMLNVVRNVTGVTTMRSPNTGEVG